MGIKKEATWANLITILRTAMALLGLIFLKDHQVFLAILIVSAILLDGVDGYVSRRYGGSKYGPLIDIAGDRIVELAILFTYAHWGLISYVFPVIFLARGLLTDSIRILNLIYPEKEYDHPLKLGKAINKFYRAVSVISKIVAFTTILFSQQIGFWAMVFALAINLVRGIPVIFNKRSAQLVKKLLKI